MYLRCFIPKIKEKTWYVATNTRVLRSSTFFGTKFDCADIEMLHSFTKFVDKNGIGTIKFGVDNLSLGRYGNTGIGYFLGFFVRQPLAFYDIKDMEHVYGIVLEAKKKLE
jgi:hypothetical protein